MKPSQIRLAALQRRVKVANLYLQGKSQADIALEIQESIEKVSSDLSWTRKQWLSSTLTDFNERKAQELAKIDNLEQAAWEAWRKSCEPVKTDRKRTESVKQAVKKGKGAKSGGHALVPVKFIDETTVREGGTGDPRFLEQVSWCIETRLRIMNLLKGDTNVTQVNINWGELVGKDPTAMEEHDPIERSIIEVENLSKVTADPLALGYGGDEGVDNMEEQE